MLTAESAGSLLEDFTIVPFLAGVYGVSISRRWQTLL